MYLAERSAHPRPISHKSQLLNHFGPRIEVLEFGGHIPGRAEIPGLRSDIRARPKELSDATLVPAEYRPMQRREPIAIHRVGVRAKFEENLSRNFVALIHGPVQRCAFPSVAFVHDNVRLAEDVQQTPVRRRVRGRVEAGEALSVDEARVGATLDEQMDDVNETLASGPLQGCSEHASANRVDFRALVDEICAHLGFSIGRGPM